jgi:hypothetical protein
MLPQTKFHGRSPPYGRSSQCDRHDSYIFLKCWLRISAEPLTAQLMNFKARSQSFEKLLLYSASLCFGLPVLMEQLDPQKMDCHEV